DRPSVAWCDRRTRLPRPGLVRGLERYRLVLRPRLPRHRSRAGRRAVADGRHRPGPHAHARRPLRARLALPRRAGPALVRRAQAARRAHRAPALPRRGPRALPLRPAPPPARPVRAHPALMADPPARARPRGPAMTAPIRRVNPAHTTGPFEAGERLADEAR